jgi:hypothetical protein
MIASHARFQIDITEKLTRSLVRFAHTTVSIPTDGITNLGKLEGVFQQTC